MIICTLSVILIIVTILAILSCVIGAITDGSDLFGFGFVVLLLTVFFGWLLMGNISPIQSVSRPVPVKVIHTDTTIILTSNDKPVRTISDVAYYKYLSSYTNLTVFQDGYVNIYKITNWQDSYKFDFQLESK